jgi:hypothetical protein
VPLVISAYDDFALADVTLLVQKGDAGSFRGRKIKTFRGRVRGETLAHTLNLADFQLQAGEFIRFRVQCRDRKDQIAQTRDYIIRLASEENAADRQLARFEEAQDTFQQRLAQLIAEQTKVSEALEALSADYQPAEEALQRAQLEAQAAARAAAPEQGGNPAQPAQEAAPAPLDAQTLQQLAELQQRLAQLAAQEQQASQQGQQLAAELGQAVQQAQQLDLVAPEVSAEMAAAQQAFEALAARAMQQLAQALQHEAQDVQQQAASLQQPAQAAQQAPPPDGPQLADLARMGRRVQQELEAVAERLAALDRARTEQARGELEAALAQLQRDMLQQRGQAAARGLEDLMAALAALRQRLQDLENRQAALMRDAEVVSDTLLPEVEEHQERLDAQAEPALQQAERLLAAEPRRRPRQPQFPDAPYEGEGEEYLVPPAEEDPPPSPEELAASKQGPAADSAADASAQPEEEEQEEPLFEPALGGDSPRLDPRFADMLRPIEPQTQADQPDTPAAQQRRQLARHQRGRLQELNLSKQAVASDERSLESLLAQLEEALGEPDAAGQEPDQAEGAPTKNQGQKAAPGKSAAGQAADAQPAQPGPAEMGEPQTGQPAPLDEAQARRLAELLDSPLFEQALAMLERLQQLEQALASQPAQAGQPAPSAQPPASLPRGTSLTGNMAGTRLGMAIIERELANLDPATRTIILQLPPRVREELLQGMQEQGPEGYQEFIRDYFRRLSTLKAEGGP